MARTILLADDSVTIQKVVELTFMDEDYEVVAVGNGDEAVAKLNEISPDLVIADVHMPGATGFDVCRATKERQPGTPVLLLVGTFEPFQEADAAAAGADGHLKKPFDSQELLRRVDELLAEADAGIADVDEMEALEEVEVESIEGFEELEGEEIEVEALEEDQGFELERSPWEEAEGAEPAEVERAEGLQNVETLGAPSDLAAGEIEEAADVERGPMAPPPSEEEEEGDATWPGTMPPAAAPAVEPAGDAAAARGPGNGLSDVDVDRIARRVAEILGDEMLRDIAWEVVPDLAEVVIKDRLRELERQVE